MENYESEVVQRWGDTDAYRQSKSKTSKYTQADFAAAKMLSCEAGVSSPKD